MADSLSRSFRVVEGGRIGSLGKALDAGEDGMNEEGEDGSITISVSDDCGKQSLSECGEGKKSIAVSAVSRRCSGACIAKKRVQAACALEDIDGKRREISKRKKSCASQRIQAGTTSFTLCGRREKFILPCLFAIYATLLVSRIYNHCVQLLLRFSQ